MKNKLQGFEKFVSTNDYKLERIGFVAVYPDTFSIMKLCNLVSKINSTAIKEYGENNNIISLSKVLPPDKMHCTLMYDSRNVTMNVANYLKNFILNFYRAYPKKLTLFNKALVLELESPELQRRHNELKKYGFKHSYPSYRPHVSLTYKYDSDLHDMYLEFLNIDLKDYLSNMGELRFHKEYWEPAINN